MPRRNAHRRPRAGPPFAAIALSLLLLPAAALPLAAPPPAAQADPVLRVPAAVWPLLSSWLLDGRTNHTLPASLADVLDLMAPAPAEKAPPLGWGGYFLAHRLDPSPEERAALGRFQAAHPHLARDVELLASDLARATLLRERAFAPLTPADWHELPGALAALSASHPLTPAQARALAAVDPQPMVEGAALLTRAALDARAPILGAAARDDALAATLPLAARDPDALARDVALALALAAGDAPPVHTTLSPLEAQRALESLTGVSPARSRLGLLPPDLAAPLANLLAAQGRVVADASPDAGLSVLATLARELAPLTRAATNLTAYPDGARLALDGERRPLAALRAEGLDAPALVLADLLGPSEAPGPASLEEGYRDLQAAMGRAPAPGEAEAFAALAADLGPDLAAALGALLAAQAAYERDLAPGAPAPARAAQARALAQPVLSSGEPLSLRDVALLQEDAGARRALRDLAAQRAGALARAALAFEGLEAPPPRPASAGQREGVLFDAGGVLVLDQGASTLDPAGFPASYLLVLDLGGDDTYRIPVAGVDGVTIGFPPGASTARTALAIDLGGDDAYEPAAGPALGAARGAAESPAFALLLDAAGHDRYEGGDAVLGWGLDGFGLLVDATGNDRYRASGRGLASAGTSVYGASAAGVLLDAQGNDTYRAREGYARIDARNASPSTYAVFLDLLGDDAYAGDCPADPATSCFASPRPWEGGATGVSVFVDPAGEDAYPRKDDPQPMVVSSLARTVVVERGTVGALPAGRDSDGDLLPDDVEGVLGGDPRDPASPAQGMEDTDEDGFIDALEGLVGTDPRDPASRPAGLPSEVAEQPLPGTGFEGGRNLLLDVPDLVAIGLPGETRHVGYHALTLDLGVGEGERDLYLNATAYNGFSLDLGGDDRYAPAARDGVVPSALGATGTAGAMRRQVPLREAPLPDVQPPVNADPFPTGLDPRPLSQVPAAALVDLAGDDVYEAGAGSQGAALAPGSVALFLDVLGDDRHRAPHGLSQGHARRGGSAWFVDLAGSDTYVSPSQGVVDAAPLPDALAGSDADAQPMPGRLALFLDASGADVYDGGQVPRRASDVDAHQGRVLAPVNLTAAAHPPVAAFLDLGGDDAHRMFDEGEGRVVDVSRARGDRLRVDPLDGGAGGGAHLFLDADLAPGNVHGDPRLDPPQPPEHDRDRDGFPDAFEIAAATDPADPRDAPYDRGDFHLRLPRLGLAVARATPSTWPAGDALALALDLGGADRHLGRAGASSPRFPVALALDLGTDDDAYESNATARLSAFAPARALPPPPEALADAHVGGAQGAGVLGIGVLLDEGGTDQLRASPSVSCVRCAGPLPLLGVAQGAGLLGVGVLALLDLPRAVDFGPRVATFEVAATAHATGQRALARTHAQGAGVAGLGVLVKEGALGTDAYALSARATGEPGTGAATSGQGYGLRGVGILLDAGGDNAFTAGELAQGAAEDGTGATDAGRAGVPALEGGGVGGVRLDLAVGDLRAEGPAGLLLLPGAGHDALEARARAQAYATAGGFAVLHDAEGDDRRTLRPLSAGPALGQAAATRGGTAILLDQRGDDKDVAVGAAAQAYADQGVALLVDLAGADERSAHGDAQAHAGVGETKLLAPSAQQTFHSSGLTFAALVDRTGNDLYALLPTGRGQGAVSFSDAGGTALDTGAGGALFLDAGGTDVYHASLGARRPLQGSPSSETGNDWRWTVSLPSSTPGPTGLQAYAAYGADDDTAPGALAGVTGASGLPHLDVMRNGAPVAGPVRGSAELRAYLGVGTAPAVPPEHVDRVEFYDGAILLGRGEPGKAYHNRTWNTSVLDAEGVPTVPDGKHVLEARIYPRVGSPAATDGTGRRVAAEVEPFRIRVEVPVDNPPVPRAPALPSENVSTALGPVLLPLRVDRDLERACPSCLRMAHVGPGPDEWAPPATPDPGLAAREEKACASQCAPQVSVRSAGGAAYVTWVPPTPSDLVVGYRVYRQMQDGAREQVGYVDARVPLRSLVDGPPHLWFVDPQPGAAKRYVVAPLKALPTGEVLWVNSTGAVYAPGGGPGPVTGVRAAGVEGRVMLAWNPAPGAAYYRVTRTDGAEDVLLPGEVRDTFFNDTTARPDRDVSYRVRAFAANGVQSPLASPPVRARASPGHLVEVSLVNETRVLPNASLGGMQTHLLPWDASALPDGPRLLRVDVTDGSGETASNVSRILLDGTAPRTLVDLPPVAGGPHLSGGTLRVPFRVVEEGSGADATVFFLRLDEGAWFPVAADPASGVLAFNNPRDGARLSILPVSVDRVGNLEGLTRALPWPPTPQDAFRERLARGEHTVHLLDTSPPGGPPGAFSAVVRPGARVAFNVTATDLGTGIREAVASIGAGLVPMARVSDDVYAGEWVAEGAGRMQVQVLLSDHAGNEGRVLAGVVLVDPAAPVLADASVAFPGGRAVGRAGETATLLVAASDPDDLTPEDALSVVADVSNVSTAGLVPLRHDPALRAYVAAFPVNRLDGAGGANVSVRVADQAGNVLSHVLRVPVNGTAPALADLTAWAGADRVTLNWTTAEPLRARVDHGRGPQLGQSTEVSGPGTRHSVTVAGLRPDTAYFLKAVALTPAGVETASPLVEVHTAGALSFGLAPVSGLPHSAGEATLRARLARFDAAPFDATLDAILQGPRASPRVVATAATDATGAADLVLDLAGQRDGEYALVLEARAGDVRQRSEPYRFVLDRTRPLMDLPAADRFVAQGTPLAVRVEERGSGVDLEKVAWTIGGRPCAAVLLGDALTCRVPPLGVDGAAPMVLRVPDRAGNVAVLEATLVVDAAAPVLRHAVLGALEPDGGASPAGDALSALRPGARARLSIDVADLGTRAVFADLTPFGGSPRAALRAVDGTRHEVTFDVPAEAPEGPAHVVVTAVDAAGHATTQAVTSRVDARPPVVLHAEIVPQTSTTALLAVRTDEPTRLAVRIAGAAVHEPVARTVHVVPLHGLLPGTPLAASLALVDDAGNRRASALEGAVLRDATPPGPVRALRLEDKGDGRVALRWEAAEDDAGVARHRVLRHEGPATVPVARVEGTQAWDEAPVGVPLRYTVIAVDHGGNEGPAVSVEGRSASVPRLSHGTAEPPMGGPGVYAFQVRVRDAGGQAPPVVVRVDGVAHPMTPDRADCREGCVYTALVPLSAETLDAGPHRYAFETAGGAFAVRHPEAAPFEGPLVLHDAPAPLKGVLSAARQVPALGAGLAGLALVVAGIALIRLRRRQT